MTNTQRPTKASIVPARFDLIDHDGNHVTNERYAGNYVLMFFGFTHCKMVCPRALAKLSDVLDSLGERAERITALYVTVDPERDTADVMKAFLTQHYPRFTGGATGSLEAIESAKKRFRVFARKRTPTPMTLKNMSFRIRRSLPSRAGRRVLHALHRCHRSVRYGARACAAAVADQPSGFWLSWVSLPKPRGIQCWVRGRARRLRCYRTGYCAPYPALCNLECIDVSARHTA